MKNQNSTLEKKAKKLLEYLDPDGFRRGELPRPFIIEITGSPDSGKTTTLEILDTFFRRQGYKVWKPLEGAEAVRRIPRKTHLYNVATGIYAMNILINHLNSGEYDLILFDRCLCDAWCWPMYWLKQRDKTLSREGMLAIQSFFGQDFWLNKIDIAFFMMCDPEVAVNRGQQWSITKKQGKFTGLESIKELYKIFRKGFLYFLKEKEISVNLVDTTKLDPPAAAKEVVALALEAFEERFNKQNKNCPSI